MKTNPSKDKEHLDVSIGLRREVWNGIITTQIERLRTSAQNGGIGKHGSPPHTIIGKITTKLHNNYHPESSENQTVWKSDNQ